MLGHWFKTGEVPILFTEAAGQKPSGPLPGRLSGCLFQSVEALDGLRPADSGKKQRQTLERPPTGALQLVGGPPLKYAPSFRLSLIERVGRGRLPFLDRMCHLPAEARGPRRIGPWADCHLREMREHGAGDPPSRVETPCQIAPTRPWSRGDRRRHDNDAGEDFAKESVPVGKSKGTRTRGTDLLRSSAPRPASRGHGTARSCARRGRHELDRVLS
jgi:hypothetical protein